MFLFGLSGVFGATLSSSAGTLLPLVFPSSLYGSTIFTSYQGFSFQLSKNWRTNLLYRFRYQGPGFSPYAPTRNFFDRSMDNYLSAGFLYPFSSKVGVRFRGFFHSEFYRLSSVDRWGEGIYDFYRVGGAIDVILPAIFNAFSVSYFWLPRYMDPLSILKLGMTSDEVLSSQKRVVLLENFRYRRKGNPYFEFKESFSFSYYPTARVLSSSSSPYFSENHRVDLSNFVHLSARMLFMKILSLSGLLFLRYYYSNQNYLYFGNPLDKTAYFIPGFFNNLGGGLKLEFSVFPSQKSSFRTGLFLDAYYFFYPSRPAYDSSAGYLRWADYSSSGYLTSIDVHHWISYVSTGFAFTFSRKFLTPTHPSTRIEVGYMVRASSSEDTDTYMNNYQGFYIVFKKSISFSSED